MTESAVRLDVNSSTGLQGTNRNSSSYGPWQTVYVENIGLLGALCCSENAAAGIVRSNR
jgi:hypothetical protein